ncbi:LysM peptidoglycan-binding domain-containing protein [Marinobacter fonticola]|uniref:LysM peptidoglycan-binding domain-containing protein n=1 Tax=Marinobacter fonticola TaxID=2603215 RepID=UPI0011E837EA|nr:LysM domain-containing protein [Marinobacter fonticola]
MKAAYTVKAGDTLNRIALKNNSTVSSLMALNPEIDDPNRIYAGQVLNMPANDEEVFSSAPATTVSGTAPCEDEYVEIVHVTGSDELYFLNQEELDELLQEEALIISGIEQLYCDIKDGDAPAECNNDQPQDSEGALKSVLQQQKQALVEELQALGVVGTSMQTTPKLTEIKRLRGNKHYTYVRSDKIANHWRSYRMDAKDRHRSEKWLTSKSINTEELRKAVEADFGVKFNVSFWKLDPESDFSKSVNQLHKEVSWSAWGDKQQTKEQLDETGFNASAEAQFMRFASGAGAFAEFTPSKGKVHLQAKADAQFSLAQGKATIEQAYPTNNESEIRIYYRKGGWNGPRTYETMGHFQARLAITASGYAGASALLAGNVHVDCSEGVPTLKGVASAPDSNDQGVNVAAEAFAGVRAGCELLGGLYWVDKLTRQSDWKNLCQVGEKVEGAAGVGVEAYLKLGFNDRSGKFFLRAHAGLVFGLGASGTFILDVNANELATMMRFVYNSLLKSDIRYLELFDDETYAFDQYIQLSLMALVKGLDYAGAATEYVTTELESIELLVRQFIQTQQSSLSQEEESLTLAENILEDLVKEEDSVFRHSPPEVKGPILNKLMYDFSWTPHWYDGRSTKVEAIRKILESFQSWRDFEESMLRMNAEGKVTPGVSETNAQKVFHYLDLEQHDYWLFKKKLENKTAIPDRPVQLDPFGACRDCRISRR